MALGKTRRRTRKFTPPTLMLTSLMDMFTIILIFLLFSFSESPETIKLDRNLELPKSSSQSQQSQTVKIFLTKNKLSVNDEVMAVVDGATIEGLSVEDPKASALFQKLRLLYTQKSNYPDETEAQADPHNDRPGKDSAEPHLMLLCDKTHAFKTIHPVIEAASLAGFPNFQCAVLQE